MNIIINYKNKIKNKYVKNGISDYKKRINRFCKIDIIKSWKISERTYVINVSKKGESITSEEFAEKINQAGINGKSDIVFVFNDSIQSDFSINLFNIDINDEILVLLLYEQVYRAYKINNNETYHK